MELIKAILLGAIQGVSEFLPISSTGHLILAENLLGISQEKYGLSFDAALHLGTLVAVLWFFRLDWLNLYTSILRIIKVKQVQSVSDKLVTLLVIGTIPGVVLGMLLEDYVDTVFRSPVLVAVTLILFSFVLIYVEKVGKKILNISKINWWDSLVVGLAQAIALVPGVSRSGITIAAGMWQGLTRAEAARFAFLLSAPIIAGAGGLKLIKTVNLFFQGDLTSSDMVFFAAGMVSAAVFGYLTIKYFLRFISKNSLHPFIIYRIVIGAIILGLILLR